MQVVILSALKLTFFLLVACLAGPGEEPSVQVASHDRPFPPAEAAETGIAPEALDLLADRVRGLVDEDAVVGAEIHVIKGRRTLLHRAFGWAHREEERPLATDSIYCVRSMTKPLVGTAVQMLLDEGKLSLDTRVADILPAFDRPDTKTMTVEHLLTHRGGLTMSALSMSLASYGSIADVAAEAAAFGLEFEPGADFNYSDAGSDTLGAIVAAVSGQPVEDFVQERILDPLGMSESLTILDPDEPRRTRIPSAYSGAVGAWERHWGPDDDPIFPLFLTSQSLYCTTTDYARFLALWMDGGHAGGKRLLSDDAIARGLEPRSEMKYPTSLRDVEVQYAQQWLTYTDANDGDRLVAFGHSGSDGTYAWAWPDEDLIVLFFTQSRWAIAGAGLEPAIERLLIDGDVEGYRREQETTDVGDLARFEGLYWDETNRRAYYVVRADGQRLTFERPGSFRTTLLPTGEPGKFTEEGGPTIIEFETEPEGPSPAFLFPSGNGHERQVRHAPDAELPDAEAVLAKLRAAHGVDRIDELGAVRLTGTIELPKRKVSGTVEYLFDATRSRYTVDLGDGPGSLWVTADGEVWTQDPGKDVVEAEGARRVDGLLTHPAHGWGGWAAVGRSTEVLKRVTKGDESLLLLRVDSDDAPGATKLVHEATGRMVAEDRLEKLPGIGVVGLKISYGDFRDVEGLTLPFQVRSQYSFFLLGEVHIRYDEVETGVDVGDAFDVPVAK